MCRWRPVASCRHRAFNGEEGWPKKMRFTYECFHLFSAPLEGDRVPTMYCDSLGLITVGTGNLINTLPQALALPWLLADGSKADQSDVAADWHKLADARGYYAQRKWTVYTKTMRCHLSPEAVDELCKRQLGQNESQYRKRWPQYDEFPADAQLAIHSMGWAVGAGFHVKFPILARCIDAQDWDGCVSACKINEEGNPGVVPRNAKNRFCFHNAALVKGNSLDPSVLYWPNVATGQASTVKDDAIALHNQHLIDTFVTDEYERIRNEWTGDDGGESNS